MIFVFESVLIEKKRDEKMTISKNNRIFIWKEFREWKPVIEDMFSDILTSELKVKIKQNQTVVKYYDDPEAFKKLTGQSIDKIITAEIISKFRQRYSHIRVYHGCRPADTQSYYEKGILPSVELKDVQVNRFRELFLNDNYPELTEKMLQQSIEKIPKKEDELSADIDDRWLIEHGGLFLIYGSEYLGNLVRNLPIENIEKYRSVLRKIGEPTMLECNLNTAKYVSDVQIRHIIERMLTEWTACLAHSETEPHLFGLTFELSEPLLPCSHYHPRKISDPFMGRG